MPFGEGHMRGSFFSCFAFVSDSLGVTHILSQFPGVLGEALSLWWEERGCRPWAPQTGRRWTEAPLCLGCLLCFLFCGAHHSRALESRKGHTLTLGKVPFLTSLHHDLPFPAPSDIFNCLLSPGSPPFPCWENRSVGSGNKRKGGNKTQTEKQ